jgi:hypothetical protein
LPIGASDMLSYHIMPRIQRRLAFAVGQKKKCVGGRQLQLMTVGDIGVVTAQRVEHYVKLTQVTNEMWKQTERLMVQVRGLQ